MSHELTFQLTTFVIIIVVLTTAANGHVALTFPRARKYDLDFLDSARTPGPCGMPRGDVKTQFLAGSKFNITWHLAYPHNRGIDVVLTCEQKYPQGFRESEVAASHERKIINWKGSAESRMKHETSWPTRIFFPRQSPFLIIHNK